MTTQWTERAEALHSVALKRVKVGDSLTAIGTEAFAIALEPV